MEYVSRNKSLFPSNSKNSFLRRMTAQEQICEHDRRYVHPVNTCPKGAAVVVCNGQFVLSNACTCRRRWVDNSPLRAFMQKHLQGYQTRLKDITSLAWVFQRFGDLITRIAEQEKRRLAKKFPSKRIFRYDVLHDLWLDCYDRAVEQIFGPHTEVIDCIELHTAQLFETQLTFVVPPVAADAWRH
jgi:hypothetical protein